MPSETGLQTPPDRVRAALAAFGHPDTIVAVPETARTAAGAAEAVGCTVAQIAKSIIFRTAGDDTPRPVLVITSGANRVDRAKAEAAIGRRLKSPDADWVRQATGFAVGGVSPVGHLTPPITLVDSDLLALDPVWAAAGDATLVFRTSAAELARMTKGKVAEVRAG